MIGDSVRGLCCMSVLCGAALSLSPEGTVKKILACLSTAVLLTAVISPLKAFDYSQFAKDMSGLREAEAELSAKAEDISGRLNRIVIQDECSAYIMDKAAKLGVSAGHVSVMAEWSSEGLWVPVSAEISCRCTELQRSELEQLISAELGIAPERQSWCLNE